MTIDVGVVSFGSLHARGFKSDHGSATVTRRDRAAAACDLAPWLLQVEIEGQQRYSFWPNEESASVAALEVLGLLAEAAAAEKRASDARAAACAVVVADVFAPKKDRTL